MASSPVIPTALRSDLECRGRRRQIDRIVEATAGIAETFFRDPKIGGMQFMAQYSHVTHTVSMPKVPAGRSRQHAVSERAVFPALNGRQGGNDETRDDTSAASHLHTPLLVVMGHQKCGAVTAAAESGDAEGHLPSLLALIRPAIERARGESGDVIENAVRHNVENVVQQVRGSRPVLAPLVERGGLRIVGAVYSLDTGKVAWLPETPNNAP
jgi:Carbonic anhydrase